MDKAKALDSFWLGGGFASVGSDRQSFFGGWSVHLLVLKKPKKSKPILCWWHIRLGHCTLVFIELLEVSYDFADKRLDLSVDLS